VESLANVALFIEGKNLKPQNRRKSSEGGRIGDTGLRTTTNKNDDYHSLFLTVSLKMTE
jgi:hypothetical protein